MALDMLCVIAADRHSVVECRPVQMSTMASTSSSRAFYELFPENASLAEDLHRLFRRSVRKTGNVAPLPDPFAPPVCAAEAFGPPTIRHPASVPTGDSIATMPEGSTQPLWSSDSGGPQPPSWSFSKPGSPAGDPPAIPWSRLSGRAGPPPSTAGPRRFRQQECVFCKNNREQEAYYRSHTLKDPAGRVVCPVLRAYCCPICHNSGGDNAHTIKYCPLNKAYDILPSTVSALKTERTSTGRRRHNNL